MSEDRITVTEKHDGRVGVLWDGKTVATVCDVPGQKSMVNLYGFDRGHCFLSAYLTRETWARIAATITELLGMPPVETHPCEPPVQDSADDAPGPDAPPSTAAPAGQEPPG